MMGLATAIIAGGLLGAGGAFLAAEGGKQAAKEQSRGARSASELQYRATREALEEQQRQFDLTREDFAPYREVGAETLYNLRDLMGTREYMDEPDFQFDYGLDEFQADPGYQFRVEEGQKAIERGAAARGGLMSGRTLKDLTRFGQGIASEEYGRAYNRALDREVREYESGRVNRAQRFNRLATLAGISQTGTSTGAGIGAGISGQMAGTMERGGARLADLATQAANVRASSYVAQTRPYAQFLQNYSQMPLQLYALSQYGG